MDYETIEVTQRKVVCEGSDGSHPKIYLEIPTTGQVRCPYCSRAFVQRSVDSVQTVSFR